MSSTVRLYGHVYDGLTQYKKEDETFDEALTRLLPKGVEVISCPEEDSKAIWASQQNHQHLKESAGENINMSDVVEYYLCQEGAIPSDEITDAQIHKVTTQQNYQK